MDLIVGDHEWESGHLCNIANDTNTTSTLLGLDDHVYGGIPDMLVCNAAISAAMLSGNCICRAAARKLFHMEAHEEDSHEPRPKEGCWLHHVSGRYDEDSRQYLLFQRYLILLMSAYTCAILGIVLPVNVMSSKGVEQSNITGFGITTMANVPPNSGYYWVHLAVAWTFLPICLLAMRDFLRCVIPKNIEHSQAKAISLEGLPRELRRKQALTEFLMARYPWCSIDKIYLVYYTAKIWPMLRKEKMLRRTVKLCTESSLLWPSMLRARQKCCRCIRQPAFPYYERQLALRRDEIQSLKLQSLMKPLDLAFVVLRHSYDAADIEAYSRCSAITDHSVKIRLAPPTKGSFLIPKMQ